MNSVMILVVLSTYAELASATAWGRSYCKTGLFIKNAKIMLLLYLLLPNLLCAKATTQVYQNGGTAGIFTPGGPLKYNVVSRRDQENTVKGLFFEINRGAHAPFRGAK